MYAVVCRYLNNNQLVELPEDLFQGLTSLQFVWVEISASCNALVYMFYVRGTFLPT
jgi:hypothetical protein